MKAVGWVKAKWILFFKRQPSAGRSSRMRGDWLLFRACLWRQVVREELEPSRQHVSGSSSVHVTSCFDFVLETKQKYC